MTGSVMVPREPTEAMISAVPLVSRARDDWRARARDSWEAMIDAAPVQPSPPVVGEMVRRLEEAAYELHEGLTSALPKDEDGWLLRRRFEEAEKCVQEALAAITTPEQEGGASACADTQTGAERAVLVFTATMTAKISVPASDENLARYAILETLQDADTDFIRSDHWERSGILAEFHIERIGAAVVHQADDLAKATGGPQ